MIARYCHDALEAGLRAFASQPGLWDDLFGGIWGLTPREVAGIRKYFAENPITIAHGFPLASQKKGPYIYLFLQGEEQPEHALGDAGGSGGAGQNSSGVAVGNQLLDASLWDHNLLISSVCPGSVWNCCYLYELTKSIMLSSKSMLQAAPYKLDLMSFGGSDAQPDMSHGSSDILYVRNLSFRCRREYDQLDLAENMERYFQVEGIALPQPAGFEDPDYPALIRATPAGDAT